MHQCSPCTAAMCSLMINQASKDKQAAHARTHKNSHTIIITYLFVVTCCFHSASRCSLLSSSHLSLSYSILTSSLFCFICSNWAACICLSWVLSTTLAEGFLKCALSWLISKTEVLVKLSARWPIHRFECRPQTEAGVSSFHFACLFAIFFVWQS